MVAIGAEPVRRVGGWWIAAFSAAWLGLWMAQLAPVQYLLPTQVDGLFEGGDWKRSTLDFGLIAGSAAIASIIAYPLAGALSDRTTGRFGRRRPWIVIGALLFALSLLALGVQTTVAGIMVFWALASAGFCALTAALTALIADQVPVGQRGLVSGLASAPQAIGIILGVILVTELFVGMLAGYAALAVLLLVLVAPFLLLVPDPPLRRSQRPPLTLRALVTGFWISPRAYPDFGWTLLSRVLVNIGNALGTGLLLYFLLFGLGREHAEDDLLVLIVIYAIASVVASVVCGQLSDRLGRRRVFVLIAAGAQALGSLGIAAFPSFETAIVGAALAGLGYGCFLSVDQALATQVLPDAASRGKDLGIMNLASAIPQALGPMLGALIVLVFGGFPALFVASAVVGVLGALAILPIRSVR
ncbi:MAG: MFS transporter [Microbacteriaceae bacterium]|nr:MFS transporter [Microbacteriaceae bacterium]